MVGPIEFVRRLLPLANRPLMPAMVLVLCVGAQTDPARRATGYGGVLPIPGPTAAPAAAGPRAEGASVSPDPHRDLRASHGRVLYAPGRTSHDTAAARTARPHKQCPTPDQRVGQGRGSVSVRTS